MMRSVHGKVLGLFRLCFIYSVEKKKSFLCNHLKTYFHEWCTHSSDRSMGEKRKQTLLEQRAQLLCNSYGRTVGPDQIQPPVM